MVSRQKNIIDLVRQSRYEPKETLRTICNRVYHLNKINVKTCNLFANGIKIYYLPGSTNHVHI